MKKFLLSSLLLAAGIAGAQTTSYTAADVAKHAVATDCWMVLNTTKVYNVTPFLSMHPAGSGIMIPYCGKDGTQAFNGANHSSNAVALEVPYLIGTLAAAPAAVSVTVAPANATASIGGTVQFTPTVANSSAGVAWTLAPPTIGSISASGMFTAIAAGQGTVTATSVQDSTKSASALITVNTIPPPTTHTIGVTVSPAAMTVNVGSRKRFRATLTNSTQGVTWSASAAIGTIDKTGLFSAGLLPGTGTVTATSIDDPTKSASAQVTLTAVTCRADDSRSPARRDD
jgi:hypothetical protein